MGGTWKLQEAKNRFSEVVFLDPERRLPVLVRTGQQSSLTRFIRASAHHAG